MPRKGTSKNRDKSRNRKLTPQQRLFAFEYLIDLNGTKAAIRAGYAPGGAAQQASSLLKRPAIRAVIDEGLARLEERTGLSIERVVEELYGILTVDLAGAIDPETQAFKRIHDWPVYLRRALKSIKSHEVYGDEEMGNGRIIEAQFWSKTDAANQLMKHLGGFAPRKVEVTHSIVDLIADAADDEDEDG